MADTRPLRVVHVPAAVGGHAPALARAERELGLDSVCIVVDEPPAGYAVDRVLAPAGTSRTRRELRRWRLIAELVRGADVVHFNFGSPLTPVWHPTSVTGRRGPGGPVWSAYARLAELRELPLLRRAGKAVCVTYQGDDARRAEHAPPGTRALYDGAADARKARRVDAFDRHAHAIFALNPDLLRVLPPRTRFLPYASVDLREWTPRAPSGAGVPVVVHAPSDRRLKGTSFVLDAVARLRAEGLELELDLVEGVPREEARRRYERADLFVDQLLLGYYGGAAVELMALGKPVVAHLDGGDLERLPAEMRADLPIERASRETLVDVLRALLTTRRGELAEIGRRSRAYVERWHDPLAIAAQLREVYERGLSTPITTTSR